MKKKWLVVSLFFIQVEQVLAQSIKMMVIPYENHSDIILESAWDAYDVTSAFVEGDSIFIATNMVQHFAQKIDTCSDIYRPCDRDEDCITFIGEMCKSGKCFVRKTHLNCIENNQGPNWCNTETSSNVFDFDITDHYYVWVRSQTNFDVVTQGKNLYRIHL